MPIRFALPLQGEILRSDLTHRVAVGCYALPLQGGGKLAILLSPPTLQKKKFVIVQWNFHK
ncbi:MAG: hypothetical protein LBK82_10050 [Planctomycetaceae bacterium]|jgi:hypothetical protein|nr:hypothetical protein [Planctomycetaceae bacterium]